MNLLGAALCLLAAFTVWGFSFLMLLPLSFLYLFLPGVALGIFFMLLAVYEAVTG